MNHSIPPTDKILEKKKKFILICCDSREHTLHAFNWYLETLYRPDHEIGLIHVYPSPEIPSFGKHAGNPYEVCHDEVFKKRRQKSLSECTSVIDFYLNLCMERGIKPSIYKEEKIDSVGLRILKVAEDTNADCIVMGHCEHGAIKRTMFGTTSEYVFNHSQAAVTIVPLPKNDKEHKE